MANLDTFQSKEKFAERKKKQFEDTKFKDEFFLRWYNAKQICKLSKTKIIRRKIERKKNKGVHNGISSHGRLMM